MESLYTLSVKMVLETGGMAAAVAGITRRFAGLSQTVQQAQSKVAAAGSAMAQSHSRAAASALQLESAQLRANKSMQDYARIASMGANAPPLQLRNAEYAARQSSISLQGATARNTAAQGALGSAFSGSQAAQEAEGVAMQRQARGQTGMSMLGAGVGLMAVGGLGLAWAKAGFSDAIAANAALTTVGLNTVGTGSAANRQAQLAALGSTALIQASQTRFSNLDILGIERTAATSGLNNRAQLNAVLPELARAAEIAKATGGVSPEESVKAFVQAAHLFKTYGTASTGGAAAFNGMVDTMTRAMAVSGGTPSELMHTISYLGGAINAYHMSAPEAITTAALASNLGLASGRGGGRLAALYRQIAPNGSGKHNAALNELQQLGHGQFFHNGQFAGTSNMLNVIMHAMTTGPLARNEAARMQLLNTVFGSAGSIAASAFGSTQAMGREHNILTLLGNGPGSLASVAAQQQALTHTPQGNIAAIHTDITDVNTELFAPWLGALNSVLGATRNVTDAMVSFLAHHSTIAKLAGGFILIASALAVVAGIALVVGGAVMVISASFAGLAVIGGAVAAVAGVVGGALSTMSIVVGIASMAFGGLDIAMLPLTLIILGIAAVVGIIILAWTHWGQVTGFVGAAFGKLGGVMSGLGNIFKTVGGYLNTYIISPLTAVWKLLLNFASSAAMGAFNLLANFMGINTTMPGTTVAAGSGGTYIKPGDTAIAQTAKGNWGGGGIGYQHNETHHHIIINGTDHATAEALANHVAAKVMEKHAASLGKHNANSARGVPHMTPRFRGA